MLISEKQILLLMDFVNDYCVILSQSKTQSHVHIYNSIRQLLDSITAQQSEELEVISNEKKLEVIGTGQLLFHNKTSVSAILHKIAVQLEKCENTYEANCFRMDWKIYYGKKFSGD